MRQVQPIEGATRRPRRFALVLAAALLVTGLAACGDGGPVLVTVEGVGEIEFVGAELKESAGAIMPGDPGDEFLMVEAQVADTSVEAAFGEWASDVTVVDDAGSGAAGGAMITTGVLESSGGREVLYARWNWQVPKTAGGLTLQLGDGQTIKVDDLPGLP